MVKNKELKDQEKEIENGKNEGERLLFGEIF